MKALQRPGRTAAVVGAVVAVSATSLIALVGGTASANEPGKCVDNVNVRAEPDPTSEIIALCEAKTTVEVGKSQNGFVQLVDLGGWAAEEFISINGATPGAARADDTAGGGPSGADASTGGASSADGPSEFGSAEDGSPNGSGSSTTDGQPQPQPKPAPGGPLSGLLR